MRQVIAVTAKVTKAQLKKNSVQWSMISSVLATTTRKEVATVEKPVEMISACLRV